MLDEESRKVLDALTNLAARDTLPAQVGTDCGISNDGRVIVQWASLGEVMYTPNGDKVNVLRFDSFVRLTGDTHLDAARGISPVFYLPGWGEIITDGSRLTRLPEDTDPETRISVATTIANLLAEALDTYTWRLAMARAAHADVSWAQTL